jgi:hypothetical protein
MDGGTRITPSFHRVIFEPNGSRTHWESHDGRSWTMTRQEWPKEPRASRN